VSYALENGVVVLDDSYNANPASMRAAFATLGELKNATRGRAICVLGEMRELGPISRREHAALGGELARHRFDLVVGCGGEINLALQRAEQAGLAVRSCAGPEEAGELLVKEVRPGDVVLFKGSRGAEVERALAVLLARHPRGSAPAASATRGVT
jgi:UDP-N-acetylmuramoyl-tripeptide--D-alanyl-D-alanine ligase